MRNVSGRDGATRSSTMSRPCVDRCGVLSGVAGCAPGTPGRPSRRRRRRARNRSPAAPRSPRCTRAAQARRRCGSKTYVVPRRSASRRSRLEQPAHVDRAPVAVARSACPRSRATEAVRARWRTRLTCGVLRAPARAGSGAIGGVERDGVAQAARRRARSRRRARERAARRARPRGGAVGRASCAARRGVGGHGQPRVVERAVRERRRSLGRGAQRARVLERRALVVVRRAARARRAGRRAPRTTRSSAALHVRAARRRVSVRGDERPAPGAPGVDRDAVRPVAARPRPAHARTR